MSRRYRHVKRGTTYTILGTGYLQHAHHELDLMPITIYRADADGTLWARYTKEFHDGRFVEIESHITLFAILSAICIEYNVSIFDIRSARRHESIVLARWAYAYLASRLTTHSLHYIGREINKDHTTMCHAIARIKSIPEEQSRLARLEANLLNPHQIQPTHVNQTAP